MVTQEPAQGLGWVSRNVLNKPVGQTPSRGGGGAGLVPTWNVFDPVRSQGSVRSPGTKMEVCVRTKESISGKGGRLCGSQHSGAP